MANFTKIEDNYIPKDGDWIKVDGILTEDDIIMLNSLLRKTVLVLDSTKGLSSELISKINNDNISFSVIGSLNYINKEKYKDDKYIERTMVSLLGLQEVIKYYESIESYINPEWNDIQKCIFLYNSIVTDFTYEENYNTPIKNGVTERSLNGILY